MFCPLKYLSLRYLYLAAGEEVLDSGVKTIDDECSIIHIVNMSPRVDGSKVINSMVHILVNL
mgnify:CR=1 FL=1